MLDQNSDITLERAFLALLLADPSSIEKVGYLEPEDLVEPQHQVAFATMLSIVEGGERLSPVSLRMRLGLSGETASADLVGALQVHAFGNRMPNIDEVGQALRDASIRRRLDRLGTRLKHYASDPKVRPDHAIEEVVREADLILASSRPQGATHMLLGEGAERFAASLHEDPISVYVPTGFAALDEILDGGLPRQEMTVMGARPSMGKSAVALSISLRMATAGRGVLFFSQEMPTAALMARVASAGFEGALGERVPYSKLKPGIIPPEHREAIVSQLRANTSSMPMSIEVRRNTSMAHMRSIIRRTRQQFDRNGWPLDLIVVDHLGLIEPPKRKHGNRVQEVTEISNGLACFAKEEDVALLALCQLNRESEKGDGTKNDDDARRPQLHHLRDSGALEQDASTVLFPFRIGYAYERKMRSSGLSATETADYLADSSKLEINVAKMRNGRTGIAHLKVDMATNRLWDDRDVH